MVPVLKFTSTCKTNLKHLMNNYQLAIPSSSKKFCLFIKIKYLHLIIMVHVYACGKIEFASNSTCTQLTLPF